MRTLVVAQNENMRQYALDASELGRAEADQQRHGEARASCDTVIGIAKAAARLSQWLDRPDVVNAGSD